MKKYFIFLIYFLAIISITSCKDMLQDLNTDNEQQGERALRLSQIFIWG